MGVSSIKVILGMISAH